MPVYSRFVPGTKVAAHQQMTPDEMKAQKDKMKKGKGKSMPPWMKGKKGKGADNADGGKDGNCDE